MFSPIKQHVSVRVLDHQLKQANVFQKESENYFQLDYFDINDRSNDHNTIKNYVVDDEINISLEITDEPFQNIPSSPLLVKHENSFSYASVLAYMSQKFDPNISCKLDHTVCGIRRNIDMRASEDQNIIRNTDFHTLKKPKKYSLSEMSYEVSPIMITLPTPIKLSQEKSRIEFNRPFGLGSDDGSNPFYSNGIMSKQEGMVVRYDRECINVEKENPCSFENKFGVRNLRRKAEYSLDKIETESQVLQFQFI